LKLFRQLPQTEQESLISYAEFLLQRGAGVTAPDERLLPEEIPRPASESVVAAMRRLSKTYFMLDKDHLLHEASDLMTAHLMQGRPAAEVIDELEEVFRRHYERIQSPPDQPTPG
jgi:hypothetical protein